MDSHGQPAPPPPAVARLTRRLGLAVLYVGAATACVVAFNLGGVGADAVAPRPVSDQPNPLIVSNGLAVDPADLDLGEVWETPRHVARIPVKNVSGQVRAVGKFQTSCVCTAVEPAALTLRPGEAATLIVSIDLTRREPHHRGLARRSVTVRIQPVFAGDTATSDGWAVSGTVLSYLSLDAPGLVFGDDLVSGGSTKSRKLWATAHAPLTRVEAEPDSPVVSARVEADGAGRYAVVVTPRPDLPPGPFRCEVAVRAVTTDGVSHPAAPFGVTGVVGAPVRVFPRLVLVGEVPVPGTAAGEVTVTLPGGGGWAVARIEAGALGVDVAKVGPGPDGGMVYRITQAVTAAGGALAEVRFVVKGPDGREEAIPVEVRWFGRPTEKKGGQP